MAHQSPKKTTFQAVASDPAAPLVAAVAAAASKKRKRDISSLKQFKAHVYQHGLPQLHAMVEQNPVIMYPPVDIQEAREQRRLAEFFQKCQTMHPYSSMEQQQQQQQNELSPVGLGKGSVRAAMYPNSLPLQAETLNEIKEFLAEMDASHSDPTISATTTTAIPPTQEKEDNNKVLEGEAKKTEEKSAALTEVENMEAQLRARWEALQQRRQEQKAQNQSNHSFMLLSEEQLAQYHHTQLNALIRLFYEFNHTEFIKIPVKQTLALLQRCGRESYAHLTEFEHHERLAKRRRREEYQESLLKKENTVKAVEEERDVLLETEMQTQEQRMAELIGTAALSPSKVQQGPSDFMVVGGREGEEDVDDAELAMLGGNHMGEDEFVADPFAAMYGADFDA